VLTFLDRGTERTGRVGVGTNATSAVHLGTLLLPEDLNDPDNMLVSHRFRHVPEASCRWSIFLTSRCIGCYRNFDFEHLQT